MRATVIYFANPKKVDEDKLVITRSDWSPAPLITFDAVNFMAMVYVDSTVKYMIRDIIRVEEVESYTEPEFPDINTVAAPATPEPESAPDTFGRGPEFDPEIPF